MPRPTQLSEQDSVRAIGLTGILRPRRFDDDGIVVRPIREVLVERTRGVP